MLLDADAAVISPLTRVACAEGDGGVTLDDTRFAIDTLLSTSIQEPLRHDGGEKETPGWIESERRGETNGEMRVESGNEGGSGGRVTSGRRRHRQRRTILAVTASITCKPRSINVHLSLVFNLHLLHSSTRELDHVHTIDSQQLRLDLENPPRDP